MAYPRPVCELGGEFRLTFALIHYKINTNHSV